MSTSLKYSRIVGKLVLGMNEDVNSNAFAIAKSREELEHLHDQLTRHMFPHVVRGKKPAGGPR